MTPTLMLPVLGRETRRQFDGTWDGPWHQRHQHLDLPTPTAIHTETTTRLDLPLRGFQCGTCQALHFIVERRVG